MTTDLPKGTQVLKQKSIHSPHLGKVDGRYINLLGGVIVLGGLDHHGTDFVLFRGSST
jgi:hypothetical protein